MLTLMLQVVIIRVFLFENEIQISSLGSSVQAALLSQTAFLFLSE